MNFEITGYIIVFIQLLLSQLKPIFFKGVNYNLINTITLSCLCYFLFSLVYVLYKYSKDHNYYKLKQTSKDISNSLNLSSNVIQNLLNPKIFTISFLSLICFITKYIGIIFLPITIAIPLGSLYIIPVLYFSYLINHEKITMTDYLASFLAIVGIVVINLDKITHDKQSNESTIKYDNRKYIFGITFTLISLIISGYTAVIGKDISDFVNSGEQMLLNSYVGILMIFPWLIYYFYDSKSFKSVFGVNKIIPTMSELKKALVFFLVIFNVASLLGFDSYNYLSVLDINSFSNIGLIISFIYAKIFFNEAITMYKIIGTLIILYSVLVMNTNVEKRRELLRKIFIHKNNTNQ